MYKSSCYGITCIYLAKFTDHALEIEIILDTTHCISSTLRHVINVTILYGTNITWLHGEQKTVSKSMY